MKTTAFALAATIGIAHGTILVAQEQPDTPLSPMAPSNNEITRAVPLPDPITHGVMFKGRDGIAYISTNGRFIIRGTIFDMWTGETINTLEEIEGAKQTIDLEKLGLKDEDVDPFYYGQGEKKVTVFIDPLCPHCSRVLDQMNADPDLAKEYTFVIYTVPFLGDQSVKAVSALSCAQDREDALRALLAKDRAWLKEHEQDAEGCDVQPIMNRTLLSQMVGVTGVPYIIGAAGGIARGAPADLREFLAFN